MKNGKRRSMRVCRRTRHYVHESAEFTEFTSLCGLSGLNAYTMVLADVCSMLTGHVENDGADDERLVSELGRLVLLTGDLEKSLHEVWCTCIRYNNALKDITVQAPHHSSARRSGTRDGNVPEKGAPSPFLEQDHAFCTSDGHVVLEEYS